MSGCKQYLPVSQSYGLELLFPVSYGGWGRGEFCFCGCVAGCRSGYLELVRWDVVYLSRWAYAIKVPADLFALLAKLRVAWYALRRILFVAPTLRCMHAV